VQSPRTSAPSATRDAATIGRRGVLNAYLNAALYTDLNKIPDSLAACDDDYSPPKSLALAAYEILDAAGGDSTEVPARVVSAAEFAPSGHEADGVIATVRVRVDTLHWRVVRDSTNSRWVVCGFAREGFDFADSTSQRNVEWRPSGTSPAAVMHLVDSIARSEKRGPP